VDRSRRGEAMEHNKTPQTLSLKDLEQIDLISLSPFQVPPSSNMRRERRPPPFCNPAAPHVWESDLIIRLRRSVLFQIVIHCVHPRCFFGRCILFNSTIHESTTPPTLALFLPEPRLWVLFAYCVFDSGASSTYLVFSLFSLWLLSLSLMSQLLR
jgi:hypothetical protein